MTNLSIFVFRRDLRTFDNIGLINSLKMSKKVIPCFFLNPEQFKNNQYKGQPSLNFMYESLKNLNRELLEKGSKLFIFNGKMMETVLRNLKVDSVFINKDYTPYGIDRDIKLEKLCDKLGIKLNSYEDYLLHPPDLILKKDLSPYKKFSPFFKAAKKLPVKSPQKNNLKNYYNGIIKYSLSLNEVEKILKYNPNSEAIPGGRNNALNIFRNLKNFKFYSTERDIPSLEKTTHLSPHLKFGTISIRETFYEIKNNLGISHPLITQLYWRDFFTYIGFNFPYVLGKCFYQKYENLKWQNNEVYFDAWKSGRTGFPIVDAGMRQLNKTGFMHNRVRMIVASFLCKDLLIDWRKGEKYFAQHLSDYDPLVNNGNWQWAAGTGCDSVPYFRIFNPWLQQEKFDRDCLFIKKWVPELKNLKPKEIHNLNKNFPNGLKYPKPIVDHQERKKIVLKIYKRSTLR